jgi:hypothetical protein
MSISFNEVMKCRSLNEFGFNEQETEPKKKAKEEKK